MITRKSSLKKIPFLGILFVRKGGVRQRIAVQALHLIQNPRTEEFSIAFSGFQVGNPEQWLRLEPLEGKFCFEGGTLYKILEELLVQKQTILKLARTRSERKLYLARATVNLVSAAKMANRMTFAANA